jgi:hypothetical protein
MTDQEINLAIAKHLGWTIFAQDPNGVIKSWKAPTGDDIWPDLYVPLRFTEQHSHILRIELELSRAYYTAWIDNLCLITNGPGAQNDGSYDEVAAMLLATPRQRAEAYLRTIGKWVD